MKKVLFRTAEFLGSMLKVDDDVRNKDGITLQEVVIAGRSNVGKSSLINHLLRHKDLARTSSKPGKTTTLNYFKIDDQIILVDLPGYGYAARSQADVLKWCDNIDDYFSHRKSLSLILLLVDARRDLIQEDIEIIKWALHHQKPLLLIFTKSDTLSKQEKIKMEKKIASFHPTVTSMYYSIKDGKSRDLLITKVNQSMAGVE